MHSKYITTFKTNTNIFKNKKNKNILINRNINNVNNESRHSKLILKKDNNRNEKRLNSYSKNTDLNHCNNFSSLTSNSTQVNHVILTPPKMNLKHQIRKEKKSLSTRDFPSTINSQNDFCSPISNINQNLENLESQNDNITTSNENHNIHSNLDYEKAFNELFSNILDEENKLMKECQEINNELSEIRFKKYFNNIEIFNIVSKFMEKKNKKNKKNKNKQKRNNYDKISENFNRYKRGLYDYPEVNKYIYGSKSPKEVFGGYKVPSKIKNLYKGV